MDKRLKDIQEAADFLRVRMRGAVPEVGIILGSGLGKLGESIEAEGVIPYREIPNFARSTAIGHKGNFIFGRAAATEEDAWDYYSYLSQSLDPDGQIELMESPTLTEEDDICSFLIASNIPVEQLTELDYEEDY